MEINYNENELANNSLSIIIPYEFINTITDISWKELHYGIKCGFILPEAAIDKAIQLINQENSDIFISLASLYKNEVSLVESYLIELTKLDPVQNINTIKEKWIYLVLSWLYMHQNQYNILQAEVPYIIEGIYEKVNVIWDDFNHIDILEALFLKRYINDNSNFIINGGKPNLKYFEEELKKYLQNQKQRFKRI